MNAVQAIVCPTYVGMNRSIKFLDTAYDCMPHVCGDEPKEEQRLTRNAKVCPTYVGMNLSAAPGSDCNPGMPHVCGDEPRCQNMEPVHFAYAPRMWG